MMKVNLICVFFLFIATYAFSKTKVFTISGYISDAGSGEKLINANVYDSATYKGAVSNNYGFYSLTLPLGDYKITYSYVGFKTYTVYVKLTEDKVLNVSLDNKQLIKEVTVVGGTNVNKLNDYNISKEHMSIKELKGLPAFMGEVDVMKALHLLPGVQAASESTSGLYVRGGGPDQNLILLDGVPVYNASHLFGFLSVFNPDAIKSVDLYKAGFPARFGGRLSSVIDIHMKEGNEKEIHGGVQAGLISSKFYLEGPIKKDKAAFHISARRTYIDILSKPFMDKDNSGMGYYFYDLNAKVNYKFTDVDRLYLSVYSGKDKAYNNDDDDDNGVKTSHYLDKNKLYWGNITTALRWNHVFSNKLFSNSTITYSKYMFQVQNRSQVFVNSKQDDNVFYRYKSGIADVQAGIAFDWYPNYTNSIKFGASYTLHTFSPGVDVFKLNSNNINNSNKNIIRGGETNAYIEDNIMLTYRMKANVGLHMSAFDVNNTLYASLEPRFSLCYLVSNNLSFKFDYSKMQQYLHLLSNSGIGLPTDLWLPATDRIKPKLSHQIAGGLIYNLSKKVTFSMEGFYKKMQHVISYKAGASFFDSASDWEHKVEVGKARAYGVEFLLKKKIGKGTGWIGYTWSKTEKLFNNINNNRWFPAHYDRTHDISVVYNYKVSDKFDFGATWVFGTGNAITLPTYKIDYIKTGRPSIVNSTSTISYFKKRNNYRMPAYHRLDIGFNFHKKKEYGIRTWSVSVYNLYGRQNPFYIYKDSNDTKSNTLTQVSLFSFLPSISYSYTF